MYFIVNLMCICMKQYICHVWVMQKIIFKITTPFFITLLSNIEYIFWCEVSSLTVTEWIYVPQTHQYELSQSWTVYTIYAADFISGLGFFRPKPVSSGQNGKNWIKPVLSSFFRPKLSKTDQNWTKQWTVWSKWSFRSITFQQVKG